MLVCNLCNHVDPRPEISFCPRCAAPLQNMLPSATSAPSDGSLSPVVPAMSSHPLVRRAPEQTTAITPQSIHRELYLAQDALMRGDPFWRWIGKHLAAYQTRQQAKESIEDLAKLQRETFVRTRRQVVDAEMARRKAEFEDAILQEQLARRALMMANYLDQLNQVFSTDRYENLPDEIRADIINGLYKKAEEMAFKPTNVIIDGRSMRWPDDDEDVTIIDADEF